MSVVRVVAAARPAGEAVEEEQVEPAVAPTAPIHITILTLTAILTVQPSSRTGTQVLASTSARTK